MATDRSASSGESDAEQVAGDTADDGTDDASSAPSLGSIDHIDVGAFIRSQREVARMSVRKLAELANVSNPYLSQIERGVRKPSAEILQQVANALRISVESLYVKAGILPEGGRAVSPVIEAIEHDSLLTDEQKLALRNVYDSFIGSRQ
ncbi:MAG TPA: helix-turn-helix transcriptional regulator [Ilumatobacter sp.]|nr:helix-turn-helix transcriptional regulator [Ilumatobacter sp.]